MSVAPGKSQMTVGEIADHLKQPLHRVAYAIKSRNIQPVLRAGQYRLFDAAGIKAIAYALGETSRYPTNAPVTATLS